MIDFTPIFLHVQNVLSGTISQRDDLIVQLGPSQNLTVKKQNLEYSNTHQDGAKMKIFILKISKPQPNESSVKINQAEVCEMFQI